MSTESNKDLIFNIKSPKQEFKFAYDALDKYNAKDLVTFETLSVTDSAPDKIIKYYFDNGILTKIVKYDHLDGICIPRNTYVFKNGALVKVIESTDDYEYKAFIKNDKFEKEITTPKSQNIDKIIVFYLYPHMLFAEEGDWAKDNCFDIYYVDQKTNKTKRVLHYKNAKLVKTLSFINNPSYEKGLSYAGDSYKEEYWDDNRVVKTVEKVCVLDKNIEKHITTTRNQHGLHSFDNKPSVIESICIDEERLSEKQEFHKDGLLYKSIISDYHKDGSSYKYLNAKGQFHREDGPAIERPNGDKVWYQNGKYHRVDGPAIEYANGDKHWYINGRLHREDGPAVELANGDKEWYVDGNFIKKVLVNKPPTAIPVKQPLTVMDKDTTTIYSKATNTTDVVNDNIKQIKYPIIYKNAEGKLHREDGPAVEHSNGNKYWYKNDTLHREDGPALEWHNGDKSWYINGRLHREDGPAVERSNGDKLWYEHNRVHREDGPAIEYANGDKVWYENGHFIKEVLANKSSTDMPAKQPLTVMDKDTNQNKEPKVYKNAEGLYHREGGPAIEHTNGEKHWYINGKRHREGGPAIERSNGDKLWYKYNKLHREDGPAVEQSNGNKEWYKNDTLHREGGPAVEYTNGDKYWYKNGKYHREDGPAIEFASGTKRWYTNGNFVKEVLTNEQLPSIPKKQLLTVMKEDKIYRNAEGQYHREDGPAIERPNGDKFWYKNGNLHREDGPAIEWNNGSKAWYKNGRYHKEDGPALEHANGDKEWWINGKRHREDGPAIKQTCGDKFWYINGKLHREDRPAIERSNGDKEWYINGKLHREDGPAIEYANGDKEWHIRGIQIKSNNLSKNIENISYGFPVLSKLPSGNFVCKYITNITGFESVEFDENFKVVKVEKSLPNEKLLEVFTIRDNKVTKLQRFDTSDKTKSQLISQTFYSDTHLKIFIYNNGKTSSVVTLNKELKLDGFLKFDENGDLLFYKTYKNGQLQQPSPTEPSFIEYTKLEDGTRISVNHYINGNEYITNKPGIIKKYIDDDGKESDFEIIFTDKEGKPTNYMGPAVIRCTKDGVFGGYYYATENGLFKSAARIIPNEKKLFEELHGKLLGNPGIAGSVKSSYSKDIDIDEALFSYQKETQEDIDHNKSIKKVIEDMEKKALGLDMKINPKENWTLKEQLEHIPGVPCPVKSGIERDITKAGYRIATTQITSAVKTSLLLLLKKKGIENKQIKLFEEVLDTEIGNALISVSIGYILSMNRFDNNEQIVKLAKEFRVEGMTIAGDTMIDNVMSYIMPSIIKEVNEKYRVDDSILQEEESVFIEKEESNAAIKN